MVFRKMGEWGMGDGRWKMEDGRWKLGVGSWELGVGRWETGRWKIYNLNSIFTQKIELNNLE